MWKAILHFLRLKNSLAILIWGLFLLSGNVCFARHIKGGWMYYQYLGTNSYGDLMYSVTLKIYRDCATPGNGQNAPNLNLTVFDNTDNNLVGNFPAPKTDEYSLQKSSFSECISPKPTICYVVLVYNTTINLPASAQGYTIASQRCCRIDGIVNVPAPSNQYGDTYAITIPGNALNPDYPKNSSPLFTEKDTAITCFKSNIVLDYSAIDPDGDKLVYSLTAALAGGNSGLPSPSISSAPPFGSLPYAAGFTPTNPFGTSLAIDANTGIITGTTPSITGEYVLAVRIQEYRNGNFIAETRKELHVVVAGCTLAAANLPPSIIACDSFTVNFQNGSSSPNIHKYFWDFGVPGISYDTSTAPTPTFVYPDTGTFYAKLVVNKYESCSDSNTTKVIVYPGFKPSFGIKGACILKPFLFIDSTTSKYGFVNNWQWDFGEMNVFGGTSTMRNASYLYPSLGAKTISLVVGDNKGCLATVQKPLTVFDKPPLNLAFHDTLICSIDTLQLFAKSIGTFLWVPNVRIINQFTASPSVYPLDTTTYYVTVTDGGCINTDSVKINVLYNINVDAGRDTTICKTDGVQLRPISYALEYQWTPVATLNKPNIKYPIATPLNLSNTYYVTAHLGKCQARDSVTIKAIPYPQSNAGNDTNLCYHTKGQLHGNIVGAYFNWSPINTLSNSHTLNPIAEPSQTTIYVLTVLDTIGCPKPFRDTVVVTVIAKVMVFAGHDTSIIIGQILNFELPEVTNAVRYNWNPSTALSNPNSENPVAIFRQGILPKGQENILYTLTATTIDGCLGSDKFSVRVFNTRPSIFVPSGFTPNSDGNNDIIRPILTGMKQLDYFKIYNRFGQLVFHTTAQNTGWNGTINGQLQPTAGYVYAAQGIDYLGNVFKQTGTFLLIR